VIAEDSNGEKYGRTEGAGHIDRSERLEAGGTQTSTRNIERVVGLRQHGVAPNPAQTSTLSVLFVSRQHGEPPNPVLQRFNLTGAFHEEPAQRGRLPPGIQAGGVTGAGPRRGGSVGRRPERGGDFPLLHPLIIEENHRYTQKRALSTTT
jgi:hypothetical protein